MGDHLPQVQVYAFAETFFHDSEAASYVFPLEGFTHYWVCREAHHMGGGISVFVHNSLRHSCLLKLLQPEVIMLSLGNQDMLLAFTYNPPENHRPSHRHDSTRASQWFQNLRDHIIQSEPHTHVCICGDFNARIGTWQLQSDSHSLQPGVPPTFSFPPRLALDTRCNPFAEPLTSMLASLGMGILNGCVAGDEQGACTRFPPISPGPGAFVDYFDSDEEVVGAASLGLAPLNPHTPVQPSILDLVAVTPHLFPLAQSLHIAHGPISDHASLHVTFSPLPLATSDAPPVSLHNRRQQNLDIWDRDFKTLYQKEVERDLPLLHQLVASLGQNSTPRLIARTTRSYVSRLKRCKARATLAHRSSPHPTNLGDEPHSLSPQHYWSREVKVLHRQLLDLHHHYRTTGLGRQEFTAARNRFTKLVRARRRNYEQARDKYVLRQLRGHPRAFWRWWAGRESTLPEISPNIFCDHMQQTLGAQRDPLPPAPPPAPAPLPNPRPHAPLPQLDMASLNSLFTVQEVVDGIYRLRNGRSSSDRVPAELLRYARDPDPERPNAIASYVKEDVARILNQVFLSGQGIPKAWLKAYVTPVFKQKGVRADPVNYRPITVSSLLYKLFATVLLTRLQKQFETLGLRAPTQLGFREHKGTEHAVWLLHHCISLACSPASKGGYGGYLYTAFIDLKAAFDSVCRQELWQHLEAMGVTPGTFLTAVKSLYSSTHFTVKIGHQYSDHTFHTHSGVKQGCPLSPLLFGMLMDRLHSRIQAECPDIGVRLLDHPQPDMGTCVPCIMYADDIVLMARSEADLQRLMNSLQNFCVEVGLSVNTAKSVVVVFEHDFRAGVSPQVNIRADGTVLTVVDSFKYLGVPFHRTKWLSEAGHFAAQAATKALWSFWKGVQSRGIVCKDTIMRIYRTQVLPVALYGSGIWGMHHMSVAHPDSVLDSPVQAVQNLFLKLLHNTPPSTSRWLLHFNVDLKLMQHHIFQGAARLWHTMKKDTSLLNKALISDVTMFTHGRGNASCWSKHFLTQATQLGVFPLVNPRNLAYQGRDDLVNLHFRIGDLSAKVTERYQRFWVNEGQGSIYTVDRSEDSTDSIKRFQNYVFKPGVLHHLHFHGSPFLVDILYRFRVGAAGLRAGLHSLSPDARTCRACHHGDVEDERHVVQHCPAYSHIRQLPMFSNLIHVLTTDGLPAFFNVPEQYTLACFLSQILRCRATFPDAAPS